MDNFTLKDEYVSSCCYRCGIPVIRSKDFNDRLRRSHATFFCLNGHPIWFPDDSDTSDDEEPRSVTESEKCALQSIVSRIEQITDQAGDAGADSFVKQRNQRNDRKLRELHEQEQAEAKLADQQAKEQIAAPSPSDSEPRDSESWRKSYSCCKLCGKPYKLASVIGKHLRDVHGKSGDLAEWIEILPDEDEYAARRRAYKLKGR